MENQRLTHQTTTLREPTPGGVCNARPYYAKSFTPCLIAKCLRAQGGPGGQGGQGGQGDQEGQGDQGGQQTRMRTHEEDQEDQEARKAREARDREGLASFCAHSPVCSALSPSPVRTHAAGMAGCKAMHGRQAARPGIADKTRQF